MIFILTGPIGSGKTTMLEKWIKGRSDVSGILMPVLDGIRHIYSIHSGKLVPVEIRGDESPEEIVRIGKFNFSKKIFNWGIDEILKGLRESNTIIVDEIGPLELTGEGFFPALNKVLDKFAEKEEKKKLILVIREGLVEKVINYFQISEYVLFGSIKELDLLLNNRK